MVLAIASPKLVALFISWFSKSLTSTNTLIAPFLQSGSLRTCSNVFIFSTSMCTFENVISDNSEQAWELYDAIGPNPCATGSTSTFIISSPSKYTVILSVSTTNLKLNIPNPWDPWENG